MTNPTICEICEEREGVTYSEFNVWHTEWDDDDGFWVEKMWTCDECEEAARVEHYEYYKGVYGGES